MIELLQQFWPHVSGVLFLLIMIGVRILYKRDVRSAGAWVGLILPSPERFGICCSESAKRRGYRPKNAPFATHRTVPRGAA